MSLQFSNHYENYPKTLTTFCKLFLDKLDYNQFTLDKSKDWKTGLDGRHHLWMSLIFRILQTTMAWPSDDSIPDHKVYNLPKDDYCMIIDYVGYLIGLPQGQGNDSLIAIYKKYESSFENYINYYQKMDNKITE